MDLLVLRIHGVFVERLDMFPAAECADPAKVCVVNRHVAAVTFAEHRAFHMGGFQLAPPRNHLTIRTIVPLAHVERPVDVPGKTHDDMHVVVLRRLGQAFVLLAAFLNGVGDVAGDKWHVHGRCVEPDIPGVARQVGLGECDELDALCGCLLDQTDGLVDACVQVEKDRGGLNGRRLEWCCHDASSRAV